MNHRESYGVPFASIGDPILQIVLPATDVEYDAYDGRVLVAEKYPLTSSKKISLTFQFVAYPEIYDDTCAETLLPPYAVGTYPNNLTFASAVNSFSNSYQLEFGTDVESAPLFGLIITSK